MTSASAERERLRAMSFNSGEGATALIAGSVGAA
jgi:hypothetical protein